MTQTDTGATAPLIVTLALDAATQGRFDRERREHFPLGRNMLSAHLTLFHHLPGESIADVIADIQAVCDATAPLPLRVTRPFPLGGGVAYALEGAELLSVHRELARRWEPWLTPQDRQPFRPHVTVQNKAPPAEARALYDHLRAAFAPADATGEGIALWGYRGGPWEAIETFTFQG